VEKVHLNKKTTLKHSTGNDISKIVLYLLEKIKIFSISKKKLIVILKIVSKYIYMGKNWSWLFLF